MRWRSWVLMISLAAASEDTWPHSRDLENVAADEWNLGDRREFDGPHVQAPASGRKQAEGTRDLGSLT